MPVDPARTTAHVSPPWSRFSRGRGNSGSAALVVVVSSGAVVVVVAGVVVVGLDVVVVVVASALAIDWSIWLWASSSVRP
jgi:Flp pilus assembly protein TadB